MDSFKNGKIDINNSSKLFNAERLQARQKGVLCDSARDFSKEFVEMRYGSKNQRAEAALVNEIYKELSTDDRFDVFCQSATMNNEKIEKLMLPATFIVGGAGALIGGAVGGAVAATTTAPVCCAGVGIGIGAGAIAGGFAGMALGAGISFADCIERGYFYSKDLARVKVLASPHASAYKTVLNQRNYEILSDVLMECEDQLPHQFAERLRDIECPITGTIPLQPFFSPNDREFAHPYERESIIAYIDAQQAKIEEAVRRGMSREKAEQEFPVCPLRGPHFTKEQLVYSREHIAAVLELFTNINSVLVRREMSEIAARVVETSILHFAENHVAITAQVIDELMDCLVAKGMTNTEARPIVNLFVDKYETRIKDATERTYDLKIQQDAVQEKIDKYEDRATKLTMAISDAEDAHDLRAQVFNRVKEEDTDEDAKKAMRLCLRDSRDKIEVLRSDMNIVCEKLQALKLKWNLLGTEIWNQEQIIGNEIRGIKR